MTKVKYLETKLSGKKMFCRSRGVRSASLVECYGILNCVGYLIPNPVYIYMVDSLKVINFKRVGSFTCTLLNGFKNWYPTQIILFNIDDLFIIFTNPSARAGYDTRLVFKRSFPSPRLVASPRLKNLVCPTIYP